MDSVDTPLSAIFEAGAGEGILNSLPDGLYITDCSRNIVFWNHAAERITGWAAEEVVGKPCSANILSHVDKDSNCLCGDAHCPLYRSIKVGTSSEAPLLVFALHKNGHRVPVEVSVAPVRDATGNVVGGVETFRDLSAMTADMLKAKQVQERSIAFQAPNDPLMEFSALYQPSDIVGGDFYFIEPLPDGKAYAIIIADAVGHGVSAALNTMLLRALWNENRAAQPKPVELMENFNRNLHELSNDRGYFGTAIAGIYDSREGLFRFTCAGHPAPMVLRAAEQKVEDIGESDPALGLMPDFPYSEQSIQLACGDILLLITDGAEEAPALGSNELGRAALRDMILAQYRRAGGSLDVKKLESSILGCSSSVHLPDDLTLMAIKRV